MVLKQLATISPGFPFREKIPHVPGGGVLVVQMKNVSASTGINWNSCIETELEGKAASLCLQAGDILFVARGNRNEAIAVTFPEHRQIQAVAAPHFYIIRCNSKAILPQYLVWWLNQRICQQYFEQQAEGSLTKSIRRTVLEQTPIAVPSLSKQRAIVQLAHTVQQQRVVLEKIMHNNQQWFTLVAQELWNDNQLIQGHT